MATTTRKSSRNTNSNKETLAAESNGSMPHEKLQHEKPTEALPGNPDNFLDERNDVLSVINDLEDQLDQYQELRESLERELTQKTSSLQTAENKVQELEWQLNSMQSRLEASEELKGEVSLLEEEINDNKTQIQRLTDQVTHDDREKARLGGELKSANKQLEEFWTVRKERDALRSDLTGLKSKLETSERDHRDVQNVRTQLEEKIRTFESNLDELRKNKAQLELELRGSGDRVKDLERIQEELEGKLEEQRLEKKGLETQLAHLERENHRLGEQRQFYECELVSLRNMNRNAENALTNVKKAFGEVRIALSETKARARRRNITSGRLPRNEEIGIDLPTTVQLDTDSVLAEASADVERV